MKPPHFAATKNAIWTVGAFGLLQVIRLGTNVALTRLLAPELFGVMVIVNSIRTGIELLTDLGIGQSIVYNRDGDKPDFYNTAWTLQATRGLILWLIACAATVPIARYYDAPILLTVMPIASFVLVLSGFASVAAVLLQKRQQVAKLSLFEVAAVSIWAVGQILMAYFAPTIWALVIGLIFASIVGLVASYLVLPGLRHKFIISKNYVWQIVHLGKWIFFSSVVYFLALNFDRLYLAGVIPFALLGVYGISRSIAELLTALAARLSSSIIFPFIASHAATPYTELRKEFIPIRSAFFLIAAVGFAFSAAFADLAIKVVFDERYHAAGWMVPAMITGPWISIFCNINEATLLGFGKPHYGAIGNALKFGWLLIGLPLGFAQFGLLGAIVVLAVSDIFRYIPSLVGQIQQRFAFPAQDLLMTLIMLALLGALEWLRLSLGFGTSFESLPAFQ